MIDELVAGQSATTGFPVSACLTIRIDASHLSGIHSSLGTKWGSLRRRGVGRFGMQVKRRDDFSPLPETSFLGFDVPQGSSCHTSHFAARCCSSIGVATAAPCSTKRPKPT